MNRNPATASALRALSEQAPASHTPASRGPRTTRHLDVSKWLTDHDVEHSIKEAKTADGRDVFVLKRCPFNEEHGSRGETVVMQAPDGKVSFKCQHSSCSEYGWKDVREKVGDPVQATTGTTYAPQLMTSSEFAEADFRQEYLIRHVLVAAQPCIVGGPKKALKTGILTDLAISLGTGTPFLSHESFEVPNQVRVLFLSGESGGFKIRASAQAAVEQRGRNLKDADILWGFELPQLANRAHLDDIAELIEKREIHVLIIDPAYLCLLAGGQSINAADVFAMGSLLRDVGRIGEQTGCTLILAHHTKKKHPKERLQSTDLDDLSMSGFAEWARQWLLLGRRSPYQSDGTHELWLNVGGSAGHSGAYVVTVDEGDENARLWLPMVDYASHYIEQANLEKSTLRAEKRIGSIQNCILETLKSLPGGETQSVLREACKPQPSSSEMNLLLAGLVERGCLKRCRVVKNGREYPGFTIPDVPF